MLPLHLKCHSSGIATSAADALPYGTYFVKETKPSSGYLLNTVWSKTFSIRENGKIIDLTGDKVREAVERGGVQIIKRDKRGGSTPSCETGKHGEQGRDESAALHDAGACAQRIRSESTLPVRKHWFSQTSMVK